MRIYVANLSDAVGEEDLRLAFESFGKVGSVALQRDAASGRAAGKAFIEMPDEAEAKAAIEKLNGSVFKGKALTVTAFLQRRKGQRGGLNEERRRTQ